MTDPEARTTDDQVLSLSTLPAFATSPWQMSTGERIALEGVLAQLRPRLAIEIGTAEGGSLQRISAYAEEVHSFDLVTPEHEVAENVALHTGDSHELLPAQLARFAEEGRNVDFVLVDGDHSAAGVRRDLEDLLGSPAIQQTVILIHDINNPEVRRGVDAVSYDSYPKVALVELDCVAGYVFADELLRHELWGGLGLVLVDVQRGAYFSGTAMQQRYFPAQPLLEAARDRLAADESPTPGSEPLSTSDDVPPPMSAIDQLTADLERANALVERQSRTIDDLKTSASWRVTKPLRAAKSVFRALR